MLEQLQTDLHYQFHDKRLLVLALTHSSAANEQETSDNHNERLEFLGDAVLELCISKELYTRFLNAREGQLTAMRSKLVNQGVLASVARSLRLDLCLILGKGEESQGGRQRDSLLSDGVEALLGAIFLDGGYTAAKEVINRLFSHLFIVPEKQKKRKDPKSLLQEVTQQIYKGRPVYRLLESSGPEHAKVFSVCLVLPDEKEFRASGTSVKRAEQTAAQEALDALAKKK